MHYSVIKNAGFRPFVTNACYPDSEPGSVWMRQTYHPLITFSIETNALNFSEKLQ